MREWIVASAIPALLWSAGPVNASGCVEDPPVLPVEFQAGKSCWYFSGVGVMFGANFTRGQTVFVRISGQDGEPLEPSVYTPKKKSEGPDYNDPSRELEFKVKDTGMHYVTFYPCGAWGEEVKIEICAR